MRSLKNGTGLDRPPSSPYARICQGQRWNSRRSWLVQTTTTSGWPSSVKAVGGRRRPPTCRTRQPAGRPDSGARGRCPGRPGRTRKFDPAAQVGPAAKDHASFGRAIPLPAKDVFGRAVQLADVQWPRERLPIDGFVHLCRTPLRANSARWLRHRASWRWTEWSCQLR